MQLRRTGLIMSVHVHKTGLNKTLGQQSDAIVTSDLTGNWIPGTGVNTHYWDNQVSSGNNLRRFNSLATGSSPNHWIFSQTNDYLGEAESGYGGSAFTVNTANAFTLAQWFKNDNGQQHIAFVLGYSSTDVVKLEISNTVSNKAVLTVYSQTPVTFDYTFADDTWYYIALVYDGSNGWSFFVNGSFVASSTITESAQTSVLQIGKLAGSATYSAATIKLGHVHVYDAAITNSQLRQNFLATQSINDARTYGATYTA